ncbi:hypothetical protein SANTM175S_06066 [Streptomyces antimycoticus]
MSFRTAQHRQRQTAAPLPSPIDDPDVFPRLDIHRPPADYRQSLSKAVTLGETELKRLLRDDKAAQGKLSKELPQPT